MKWLVYIVITLIGICFAVMGMFNNGDVVFNYLFGQQELPLIVVMLICFILGAVLTMLLFGIQVLYWRGRAKSVEKQLVEEYREADRKLARMAFEESKQS